LVVITCAALAVAGWWWWSGRPRAIAVAPTVLATGAPITMLPLVSAPSAPVPASSADSMSADPIAADPMSVDPIDTGGLSPTTPVADPSALLVPASSGAPSSGPPVVVHVIGVIRRPGLVTLPAGSRVADAVEAAGGVTRRRAADSVNLARVLVDGEQIVIAGSAAQGATRARSSPTVPAGPVTRPGTTGATPAAAMDLNAVDAATLELLPGVGPVLADRIVMWRTANGPFRSIEELGEVSGIGDSIMAQLRPLVRV
jgi:competence protein ComEA